MNEHFIVQIAVLYLSFLCHFTEQVCPRDEVCLKRHKCISDAVSSFAPCGRNKHCCNIEFTTLPACYLDDDRHGVCIRRAKCPSRRQTSQACGRNARRSCCLLDLQPVQLSTPTTQQNTAVPLTSSQSPLGGGGGGAGSEVTQTTAGPAGGSHGEVSVNIDEIERICGRFDSTAADQQLDSIFFPDSSHDFRTKIVDGDDVTKGDWPWICLIGLEREPETKWICGGVIISEYHVLTAAHCIVETADRMVVRVGEHNLDEHENTEMSIYVQKTHVNEQFIEPPLYHDIAILELADKIQFTQWIRPICISRSDDYEGGVGSVAGWGHTDFKGETSSILQEITIQLLNNTYCEQKFEPYRRVLASKYPQGINHLILCAFNEDDRKDACQGDSGGPMVRKYGERHEVIGVVSSGLGCGGRTPGIYTRVNRYTDWIWSILTGI